jgi:hypothetical protein
MFEMILANLERKIRGYSHTLRLFSKGVSRTFAQTPDICGTRVHRLAAAFAALRFLCSTSSSFYRIRNKHLSGHNRLHVLDKGVSDQALVRRNCDAFLSSPNR